MRMMGKILAAAALAAAMVTPALAADTVYEQGRVRVQTAVLDLSSAAGQRQLEKRLSSAVNTLCGSPVFFSRDEASLLDACHADALQAAAEQIDAARARKAVAVASIK